MTKLGKTQVDLLSEACRSRLGRVAVEHGCIVGACKPRSYGRRAADAAIALRRAGLLEHVSTSNGVDSGRWSSHHYSTAVFRITDAGRNILENIRR